MREEGGYVSKTCASHRTLMRCARLTKQRWKMYSTLLSVVLVIIFVLITFVLIIFVCIMFIPEVAEKVSPSKRPGSKVKTRWRTKLTTCS